MQFTLCGIPTQTKLGKHLYFITGNTLYGFGHDLFTKALSVYWRRINRSNAIVVRGFDRFDGFAAVCPTPHPSANGPCAESDDRCLNRRSTELSVFHILFFHVQNYRNMKYGL